MQMKSNVHNSNTYFKCHRELSDVLIQVIKMISFVFHKVMEPTQNAEKNHVIFL
jgi:hypothetical protein